jgi:hypothetical protein
VEAAIIVRDDIIDAITNFQNLIFGMHRSSHNLKQPIYPARA